MRSIFALPTEKRVSLPGILPAVWQIAPPLPGFILTPEQHRRRAQDLRDASRPHLARQHDNVAKAIEYRRRPSLIGASPSPCAVTLRFCFILDTKLQFFKLMLNHPVGDGPVIDPQLTAGTP
jgi:hypothetical protein